MPTSNPTWFKPAQEGLTYEDSGIVEQTEVVPGHYWITPEGKLLVAEPSHLKFADQFLGGVDNAYQAGCVRTGYQGDYMFFSAQDCPAFNNPTAELLVRQANTIAAETMKDPGIYVQFLLSQLTDSNLSFGDYMQYRIDKKKITGVRRLAAEDRSKVIEEPLTVDHLTITFHEKLFDYYLAVPNMDPGWYITEIGGMKVGFGSKYQLKKFLLKLKTEFFTDGNLPGSNIRIAPIPEIEEPLVRRMGSLTPPPNLVITQLPNGVNVYLCPACFSGSHTNEYANNHMSLGHDCKTVGYTENGEVTQCACGMGGQFFDPNTGWIEKEASVPIKENNIPIELKRKLEQGSVGPQVWEISEGSEDSNKTLNSRPTGPML